MRYPKVLSEYKTIGKVLQGYSLARFGDGELKIMYGKGYSREPVNPELTLEMRTIFQSPHPKCLVGIPTMSSKGPKYDNWMRHRERFVGMVSPAVEYVSAFVSRPDSAPWINRLDYAEKVQQLWKGKRVVVVCEANGSMIGTVRLSADAYHVVCPHSLAYGQIDRLEEQVVARVPDVAILAAGPTATCLANRLTYRGIHAVDLGSAGQFLGKLLA